MKPQTNKNNDTYMYMFMSFTLIVYLHAISWVSGIIVLQYPLYVVNRDYIGEVLRVRLQEREAVFQQVRHDKDPSLLSAQRS